MEEENKRSKMDQENERPRDNERKERGEDGTNRGEEKGRERREWVSSSGKAGNLLGPQSPYAVIGCKSQGPIHGYHGEL